MAMREMQIKPCTSWRLSGKTHAQQGVQAGALYQA
jgi:hypothetical protein